MVAAKIAKSQQWFDRLVPNLARLRIWALRTGPALKICNFYKLKMADGCYVKK